MLIAAAAATAAAAAAVALPPRPPGPFMGEPVAYETSRWWLENDGYPVGTPDADVDAEAAWEITRGNRSVIVAIVDTGVDVAHPQLAASILVNTGEIPGNGIDDDGNGFVDDVFGWDFADGDADVLDPFQITHGSLVAGLVTGETTGLAPGVSILPVKVFPDDGGGTTEEVLVAGLRYAIDRGADVIQIAWDLGSSPPSSALDEVFADAEAAGIVVVVAAGNAGQDLDAVPSWPASYPHVLTVAGTDRHDRLVELGGLFTSAFGPATVEIAAPTEKLTSTLPGGFENLFTGTSAAAPLVSAAAALVLSVDPSLTPADVRDILLSTADRLPSLEGRVASGRLNAANAVRVAAGLADGPLPTVSLGRVDRAEPWIPTLLDARGATHVASARWWITERERYEEDATLLEAHRFFTGGLWPVSVEVVSEDGLTATAHTEVFVPFRGTSIDRTDASPHPYPPGLQLVTITVPDALALRLHFEEIGLVAGDEIILYDQEGGGLRAITGSATDHVEVVRGHTAHLYLIGRTGGGFGFALERVDAVFERDANRAPHVEITGSASAIPGTEIELTAVATDPDGDPLTLAWRVLQRPEGSVAALSSVEGTGLTRSLTPDARGSYAIAVTASDGISEGHALAWITTRDPDASGGLSCAVAAESVTPTGAALAAAAAAAALAIFRWRRRAQ